MLKAVLITVQHSGTRATANALRSGIDMIANSPKQPTNGNYLMQMHIARNDMPELKSLANLAPVIYTVRDPLASLVSTLARGEGRPEERTRDWADLVEITSNGGFPVSIGFGDPEKQIQNIFDKCDFYDVPLAHEDFGAFRLKNALQTAYKSGDWDYLQSSIGDEIKLLQAQEKIVRPWLEAHGLTDLMWFS